MSTDTLSESASQFQSKDESPQFYLARFEKEQGTIMLNDGREQSIALSGEILVTTRPSQDKILIIDRIHSVALWSNPLEELHGIASLAGPANEIKFEPGPTGVIAPFDMRLYYSLLSDLKPACTESDAVYPQLELIQGKLIWEPERSINDDILRARVTISLDKMIDQHIGAIQAVTFGPTVLSFQPVREQPYVAAQANSLIACDTPKPAGTGSVVRELRVRFVSLVLPVPANYEDIAKELLKGACKVWWEKGGLKIVPTSPGVDPTLHLLPTHPFPTGIVAAAQETDVPADAGIDPNSVDIYLAAELTGNPALGIKRDGGGVTHNCRTQDAFIILDVRKAVNNRYLLAHELGHVLGLRHPGLPDPNDPCSSAPGITPGSFCSVMVPQSPNSSLNTAANLAAIQAAATPTPTSPPPLGPVITSLTVSCGLKADDDSAPEHAYFPKIFHIISDFPYDRGAEDSVPEAPFTDWWSASDVWNSGSPPFVAGDPNSLYNDGSLSGKPMFKPNYAPDHSEPSWSGPNNMYVRLHTCQNLDSTKWVKVHLLLAIPGAPSAPLTLVPVVSGTNPIVFSSASGTLPTPGFHRTGHITWNVPPGYPAACCVFAVAQSDNEPTPAIDAIVGSSGTHHFSDLFSRLASDNDVAQRNLHIQGTPPPPPSPRPLAFSSTLAWLEMSNPFERVAAARLEIDATQARGLLGLTLEADDKILDEIKPGEQTSVTLADALRPEDHMILRFRATLPPNASEGTEFPISLRFVVKDQLVSGYTHLLRIVPLQEAVLQVLDYLYGALRDVGVGCKSKQAQDLAEQAKEIVLRERLVTQQPLGCSGLLWMILRRKNEWRSEVGGLSKDVAALAQSLESSEPECQAVSQHLYKLSELVASKDIPDAVFIEQIRDLADRIQEPAGRLARRSYGR